MPSLTRFCPLLFNYHLCMYSPIFFTALVTSLVTATIFCMIASKMWTTGRDPIASEEELEEMPKWLDQSSTRKQWESKGRVSCDQREPIKTVEIDTYRPYAYSQRSHHQHHCYQPHRPSSFSVASPVHRTQNYLTLHSPITPSPYRTRHLQVHSASPRCLREERDHPVQERATEMPNYMAATASAKARFRSQSAPRQRPSTPEREKTGSAKKRLSFPAPDPCGGTSDYNSKSPSYKNIHGGHLGMEQRSSNMSSCCTDSFGDEISPHLTNDLRSFLR